jgi:hypothetical protein
MGLRALVDAKCRQCIYDPSNGGYWRQQVGACTVQSCRCGRCGQGLSRRRHGKVRKVAKSTPLLTRARSRVLGTSPKVEMPCSPLKRR